MFLVLYINSIRLGPLIAAPQCYMSILRNGDVAYFTQRHFSNLRKGYFPSHYNFPPTDTPCMSNLRNAHVARSILVVKGH